MDRCTRPDRANCVVVLRSFGQRVENYRVFESNFRCQHVISDLRHSSVGRTNRLICLFPFSSADNFMISRNFPSFALLINVKPGRGRRTDHRSAVLSIN